MAMAPPTRASVIRRIGEGLELGSRLRIEIRQVGGEMAQSRAAVSIHQLVDGTPAQFIHEFVFGSCQIGRASCRERVCLAV